MLLGLVLGVLAWQLSRPKAAPEPVRIIQDGAILREIDLSRVTEPEIFTVDCPGGGSNVIEVQPGKIRVLEADCPDGVCVRQGWLGEDTALPLVCLPHRLVIQFAETGDLDAATR